MKICPKCSISFTCESKWGAKKFCSRKCANSRVFTPETIEKKSLANKKYFESLTVEQRANITERTSIVSKQNSQRIKETWLKKLLNMPFDELGWTGKRRIVIHNQQYKCGRCGLSEWYDTPIPLEVDHKNGNRSDNSYENLEALCPNCHSITPSWRGRNKRTTIKITDDDLLKALSECGNIRQALLSLGLAGSGGNYKRFYEVIEAFNTKNLEITEITVVQ